MHTFQIHFLIIIYSTFENIDFMCSSYAKSWWGRRWHVSPRDEYETCESTPILLFQMHYLTQINVAHLLHAALSFFISLLTHIFLCMVKKGKFVTVLHVQILKCVMIAVLLLHVLLSYKVLFMCYEIECSSNYTYSLYEYFDATLLLPPPPKKREGESWCKS